MEDSYKIFTATQTIRATEGFRSGPESVGDQLSKAVRTRLTEEGRRASFFFVLSFFFLCWIGSQHVKINICLRSEELPSEESLFLSNRRSKKSRALNTRTPREVFDTVAGVHSDENLKEDVDRLYQWAGSSCRGFCGLFDSLFCSCCCPGYASFASCNNGVGLKSQLTLLRIHLCCFNH